MVTVTVDNFVQLVIEESKTRPVLVDFWAEWCGPCKALGPVLESLEKDYKEKFLLVKIDTESEQQLAKEFKISSIPAVKLFINGVIADEFTGALPEEKIVQFLEKYIPSEALEKLSKLAEDHKFSEIIDTLKAQKLLPKAAHILVWQSVLAALAKDQQMALDILHFLPASGGEFSSQKSSLTTFLENEKRSEVIQKFKEIFEEKNREQVLKYFLDRVANEKDADLKEKDKQSLLACFSIIGNSDPMVTNYRKQLSRLLY